MKLSLVTPVIVILSATLFGLEADAAFGKKTDAEGKEQVGATEGTVGLNEDVTVYQMTKKGLALQVTLQGTKYWKDDDLD